MIWLCLAQPGDDDTLKPLESVHDNDLLLCLEWKGWTLSYLQIELDTRNSVWDQTCEIKLLVLKQRNYLGKENTFNRF